MALTATATQGFEFVRCLTDHEVIWVPGDVGDTFTRGDVVTMTAGEGILDLAASGETPLGVVEKTVTTPALAQGFPDLTEGKSEWADIPNASNRTMVAIRPFLPVGSPIFRATFASHQDATVVAYTAGTPSVEVATAAQDDANGALLYVYDGPGAGQWNVVADVDAANVMTLHRAFDVALTAASKIIWLAGEAADNRGVSYFGRCNAGDQNNLVVNNGADDGEFLVYLDARNTSSYLKALTLPVIPASLAYFA